MTHLSHLSSRLRLFISIMILCIMVIGVHFSGTRLLETHTANADETVHTMLITDSGLVPATIHIQENEQVTWINQTSAVQDIHVEGGHQLFLPLVLRRGSTTAAAAHPAVDATAQIAGTTAWRLNTVEPGQTVTRTFARSGSFTGLTRSDTPAL